MNVQSDSRPKSLPGSLISFCVSCTLKMNETWSAHGDRYRKKVVCPAFPAFFPKCILRISTLMIRRGSWACWAAKSAIIKLFSSWSSDYNLTTMPVTNIKSCIGKRNTFRLCSVSKTAACKRRGGIRSVARCGCSWLAGWTFFYLCPPYIFSQQNIAISIVPNLIRDIPASATLDFSRLLVTREGKWGEEVATYTCLRVSRSHWCELYVFLI